MIPKGVFYLPRLVRIRQAISLTQSERLLELELDDGRSLGHRSGQFVLVSKFGIGEIPVSVCSSPDRSHIFKLCISAVGNVSRALCGCEAGDWVGIRGPYGVGFPEQKILGKDMLIIAAGLGLAPLRGYIHHLLNRREDIHRLDIIYGARHPSAMIFREDIESWRDRNDVEVHWIVDEPDKDWAGPTGVVTDPLGELEIDPANTLAAAVGPPIVFRFVADELLKKGMNPKDIYFSLERNFHCGIGKCGHCRLNDFYVCQDGPVFAYSRLMNKTEVVEAAAPG